MDKITIKRFGSYIFPFTAKKSIINPNKNEPVNISILNQKQTFSIFKSFSEIINTTKNDIAV